MPLKLGQGTLVYKSSTIIQSIRFSGNDSVQDVWQKNQTISYYGVNAHHQNSRSEKTICDIQEGARKLLLHAKARWPSAITVHLWPYALRHANDVANSLPDRPDGTSPIERYSSATVSPLLRENHIFGCPVFAFDNNLQSNKSHNKWELRARLGIYLERSPRHARNVSLVLSLTTGLVSPQFHVIHDDFFEIVKSNPSSDQAYKDKLWQRLFLQVIHMHHRH